MCTVETGREESQKTDYLVALALECGLFGGLVSIGLAMALVVLGPLQAPL